MQHMKAIPALYLPKAGMIKLLSLLFSISGTTSKHRKHELKNRDKAEAWNWEYEFAYEVWAPLSQFSVLLVLEECMDYQNAGEEYA